MKRQKMLKNIFIYALLIIGSFICLVPFYWLFRSSLMEMSQIFVMPPIWIPNPVQFQNYIDALTILPFLRYFLNTTTIVIFTVTGVVLTSSISAYGFSRVKWPGRDLAFGLILSSMMLPYAVTLIPTFIGWKLLNGMDTYLPLIVPSWFGGGAFNIFLLRQFYMTIPRDLDESAFIDGAGHFRIYAQIILPLTKPALIVVGLFAFMGTWNDFLGPLVYLSTDTKYTLALGLQQFQGLYNAQWHLMMAAASMVLLPIIIVFLIGQKYFIEGIAMTGLKA